MDHPVQDQVSKTLIIWSTYGMHFSKLQGRRNQGFKRFAWFHNFLNKFKNLSDFWKRDAIDLQ